jgi:hypothetical protein
VPFDRQSIRITFNFIVSGTPEIAVTGLTLAGEPGFNAVLALAELASHTPADMVTALNNALMAGVQWADYSHLTGLKMSARGTDGIELTDSVDVAATADYHGVNTNVDAQLTEEISLWSGQTFGHANYGKMYLPHTRLGLVAGSPLATTAAQSAALSEMTTFVQAVNTWATFASGDPVVSVMSSIGAGARKTVAFVRVGRVVDTQRRRRNKLDESYVQSAV